MYLKNEINNNNELIRIIVLVSMTKLKKKIKIEMFNSK